MTNGHDPQDFSGLPSPPPGELPPERRLTASKGLIGFLLAIVATFFLAGIAGAGIAIAGGDLDGRGFIFVGTLIQDGALIAAAFFITADLGRTTGRTFGLRPFQRSAFKWLVAAFFAYYALAIVYALIFSPPEEELPKELGAEDSVGLAIATGVLLIAIAPIAEEVFFRGFLYQSFRNSFGVWPGAILSGLVFGVIHLEFFKLVQLAILGVILALLFEKTRSLWPPIMLHAINNTLAFIYLMSDSG
ncbi:MAG TPA: type II CAAX endopeptidase family protein [Solirubrobacterales bacterium]|nr:type II CAAX endopeptidase family protein [Solirubrobacterales bacterium]